MVSRRPITVIITATIETDIHTQNGRLWDSLTGVNTVPEIVWAGLGVGCEVVGKRVYLHVVNWVKTNMNLDTLHTIRTPFCLKTSHLICKCITSISSRNLTPVRSHIILIYAKEGKT